MSDKLQISRRQFLLPAPTRFNNRPHRPMTERKNPANPIHHQRIQHILPIHPNYWTFAVAGLVNTPLFLSYEDTLALPAMDARCPLICSGKSSPRMGPTIWTGVPILTLLNRLNIPPEGRFARFVASDGYTTSLPMNSLSNALLVYAINGEPLAHEHGFPARLIVPGMYGYKMPKWITRMELTDAPAPGFWEARGWPASGIVQATATILSPRHHEAVNGSLTIRGHAYAGEHDISRIEVSIDDGPWMPVSHVPAASPYNVTEWQIDWTPPAPGYFLIKTRAWDSAAQVGHPHGVVVRVLDV